jgi:hypothetical protein
MRRVRSVNIKAGWISAFLTNASVGLLRAEDHVFEAMLKGWRAQILALDLLTSYVKSSCGTVQRFEEHAKEYRCRLSTSARAGSGVIADRFGSRTHALIVSTGRGKRRANQWNAPSAASKRGRTFKKGWT